MSGGVNAAATSTQRESMRLTDILKPECIKVPLDATDRQAAVYELIDLLVASGCKCDADEAKRAVWQRESTRTTGIGQGLAIPHGKCPSCEGLILAIGRPARPNDFEFLDDKPVDTIFLLVSNPSQTGPHIQTLARISRLMTDESFRKAFAAVSAERMYQLIAEREAIAEQ